MSSHSLEIEAGDGPNLIVYHKIKCSSCQLIEDEFHFVLDCQLYSVLRKKYISNYHWKRPSMVKLLNSDNQTRSFYSPSL